MKNRTETGQSINQGTFLDSAESKPKPSSRVGKDDVRYWKGRIKKRSYKSGGKLVEIAEWQVRLYSGKLEQWFSLGTKNKDQAARKARDIYLFLRTHGMEQTLAQFRTKTDEPSNSNGLSLGDYIATVEASTTLNPETLHTYTKKTRQIVAEILGVTDSAKKYDAIKGGRETWREKIDSTKLAILTPDKIIAWKKRFVSKAGADAIQRRCRENSANSCLRNAKALFSKKLISQLPSVTLPDPVPFRDVAYFPKTTGSARYRSRINVEALIEKADKELRVEEPQQYKCFLLGVFVGLRRKEIDMLRWIDFDWDRNIIRVRPNAHHALKSAASEDDVPVEPKVMRIFHAFFKKTEEEFVIYSDRPPSQPASYRYYRADLEFKGLIKWLREKGIEDQKPIHTLRKEFGRLITEKYGIFAASKLLRHSSIQVTASHYADDTRHLTIGLGDLIS